MLETVSCEAGAVWNAAPTAAPRLDSGAGAPLADGPEGNYASTTLWLAFVKVVLIDRARLPTPAAASRCWPLFRDWNDALALAVRGVVHCLCETMLELDAAQDGALSRNLRKLD